MLKRVVHVFIEDGLHTISNLSNGYITMPMCKTVSYLESVSAHISVKACMLYVKCKTHSVFTSASWCMDLFLVKSYISLEMGVYFIFTLKMLPVSLTIDTLIIGHTFCSVLSTPNELTLQKELQNFMTIIVFWAKGKNKTKIKTNKTHNNLCQRRESNHRPVAR